MVSGAAASGVLGVGEVSPTDLVSGAADFSATPPPVEAGKVGGDRCLSPSPSGLKLGTGGCGSAAVVSLKDEEGDDEAVGVLVMAAAAGVGSS